MYKYLIVDDEPMIRYSVRYMLKQGDFPIDEILEAENGIKAKAILQNNQINFIFIDINMPKMNGLELAEYVYEHARDSIMCIISGYDDFKYAQTAIRFGVRAYLLKPVNRKELYETLAGMINEMKKRSSNWMNHDLFSEYAEAMFQAIKEQNADETMKTAKLFLQELPDGEASVQEAIRSDMLTVLAGRVSAAIGDSIDLQLEETSVWAEDQELCFMHSLNMMIAMMKGILSSPYYKIVDNARRYMERNGWNITLEEISKELGLNASYFSRIFREECGMTFVAYRTELRMKRAGELLENLDKSVSSVAADVGYGDVTHFIRVFKKHKGQSPSEYRKRIRL